MDLFEEILLTVRKKLVLESSTCIDNPGYIIARRELLAKGQAPLQLEVTLCYACYEVMMLEPFGEILWLSAKHSEWFLLLVPNKLKKKPS